MTKINYINYFKVVDFIFTSSQNKYISLNYFDEKYLIDNIELENTVFNFH